MKLSRLLAALALIAAAALAIAAPASAEPTIVRPVPAETLNAMCTIFRGTFIPDRTSSVCQVREGNVVCAERCQFQATVERLSRPPLMESCELGRGSFFNVRDTDFACDLVDGDFTVACPGSWLLGIVQCDVVLVMDSEQPMT
ncbi:hypothetical protein Rhe02_36240 [Rhizocola hellebori]|uniref:Uncharacterized protein n=1 Tax=Rhizocola hellebori TaxID=1392758 RepID=A0A8J3Q9A2_9ACTN|nr:hypothetical protein [Rhizocola hellebori]GIH05557.1 hypothetical protein Rhe02_36240 [Rhizocola hellebori]